MSEVQYTMHSLERPLQPHKEFNVTKALRRRENLTRSAWDGNGCYRATRAKQHLNNLFYLLCSTFSNTGEARHDALHLKNQRFPTQLMLTPPNKGETGRNTRGERKRSGQEG